MSCRGTAGGLLGAAENPNRASSGVCAGFSRRARYSHSPYSHSMVPGGLEVTS